MNKLRMKSLLDVADMVWTFWRTRAYAPSHRDIQKLTGLSLSTVTSRIQDLERLGLIVNRGRGNSIIPKGIKIILPPMITKEQVEQLEEMEEMEA